MGKALPRRVRYDKSMPNHDDNNLQNFIAMTVETLRDRIEVMAEQMATKSDLNRLESSLMDRLHAESTVIRGDIEHVHLRLDSIDRTLSSRMSYVETELSRFRSVLYLLVKDNPDMLRLLGRSNPGESPA